MRVRVERERDAKSTPYATWTAAFDAARDYRDRYAETHPGVTWAYIPSNVERWESSDYKRTVEVCA